MWTHFKRAFLLNNIQNDKYDITPTSTSELETRYQNPDYPRCFLHLFNVNLFSLKTNNCPFKSERENNEHASKYMCWTNQIAIFKFAYQKVCLLKLIDTCLIRWRNYEMVTTQKEIYLANTFSYQIFILFILFYFILLIK